MVLFSKAVQEEADLEKLTFDELCLTISILKKI